MKIAYMPLNSIAQYLSWVATAFAAHQLQFFNQNTISSAS